MPHVNDERQQGSSSQPPSQPSPNRSRTSQGQLVSEQTSRGRSAGSELPVQASLGGAFRSLPQSFVEMPRRLTRPQIMIIAAGILALVAIVILAILMARLT